ncbi:MAG TPA: flippase-like domain-containing protein [Gemmatimonadaceae bacterium]|nr:flippase-like domain-containing protein [Gemmatimonadaceae bacterium]
MKLRGAILGAGNIALKGHLPQWTGDAALASQAEIIAIADLAPANLEAASKLIPNARLYEHADELLARETVDFCDVCTPPFTHKPLVTAAAARGYHVLCEKPIAPSLSDAEAIADSVRAARVVFLPCHQYHYSPQWQAVVRLLKRIGRIHLADYSVHRTEANPGNPNWSPSWRTDRSLAGGGILFDHGAHIFYQLRSVMGEPASVQATVRTLRHAGYGVEDSALVVLDYGDRIAEVRLTWAARERAIRFHFVGEAGELVGDDKRVTVRAAKTEEINFDEGMSGNSSHSGWYAPLMRDLVARIRANDVRSDGLDEALYVARVIDRAYESSEQRRALPLTDGARAGPDVGRAIGAVAAAVSRVVEPPAEPAEPPRPAMASALRTPWLVRAAGLAMLALAAGWIGHDIDWTDLRAAISSISALWVALAVLINLGAVYAMAGRWRALLQPLTPFMTQMEAYKAMLMGFAVSTIVPARAGEFARAEWLARRTGLPRAAIFGSIVLDALVNAVGLFILIAILPLIVHFPAWARSGIWLAVVVFGIAAAGVFLLRPKAGQPVPASSERTDSKFGAVTAGFLSRARLGLAAVEDQWALAKSFAMSGVAWALEICVVLCTLRAFHLHVPIGTSLLILMAVNVALVVPFAPPANLGSLEVGATLALMESGVPKETALAFALVYHLLQVIPIGFAGLGLASQSLLPKGATRAAAAPQATSPETIAP